MTPRQSIETFHLVFLRALMARLEDKTRVVLKGGANLRFYFQSIRYSEDMDFDVTTVAKATLEKKVDDLLKSPLVVAPLRAQGLALVDVSKPKQTQATQRWKMGLSDQTNVTRTRIEFSRRSGVGDTAFEATSQSVPGAYGMPAFLATHYSLRSAIVQKIHALADRKEPQPRDVFDLNHLFARQQGALQLSDTEKAWLAQAVDHTSSMSFDDYSAKVVAFLEPDQAELFASPGTWDLMQSSVADRLAELEK